MPGAWVNMPGGGVAHVRFSRKPRRRCSCCRDAWATLECDHPTPSRKSGTCDKPLCRRCAVNGGENIDYCPTHPPAAGAQLAMEGL